MKDPYATFNTHITTVNGLVSMDDSLIPAKMSVDVRFTSDSHETLSLTVSNLQIAIPFEKVQKIIDDARKNNLKA